MNVLKGFWFSTVLPAIIVMGLVSTGSAGSTTAIKLPKTGQVTCYDGSGSAVSCANTGQDGDLQKGAAWPNPRFAATADTAITDNLTGLVWSPNGNLPQARDPQWEKRSTIIDGALAWQHALDYVAKLNAEKYLGHNDWRLPNFTELESLVNRAQPDTAAWLNSQGFINAQAGDYYWSSTSNSIDAGKAWVVDMSFGNVNYFNKANSHYVWPVRAGQ
jgi:uncharacterized protein DUF1566